MPKKSGAGSKPAVREQIHFPEEEAGAGAIGAIASMAGKAIGSTIGAAAQFQGLPGFKTPDDVIVAGIKAGFELGLRSAFTEKGPHIVREYVEPECPKAEHAGKWIAWSSDGLRILGVATTVAEAERKAIEQGEHEPILEVAPGSHRR